MTEPSPPYHLTRVLLASTPKLPLTEEEFWEIAGARSLVREARGLEEKFNLVLENYMEYENELLSLALQDAVFRHPKEYGEAVQPIYTMNRRVLNFLSATRLFRDHARKFNSRQNEDMVREWQAEEAASSAGYRIMENLRNHIQHDGWIVHSVSRQHWREAPMDRSQRPAGPGYVAVVPQVHPAQLSTDERFDRAVLSELLEMGESVDLRPLIHQHVVGLASIHQKLREEVGGEVAAAEETVLNQVDRYEAEGDGHVLGLAAISPDDSKPVPLFREEVERLRSLEFRNGGAVYTGSHFVTNRPR